MNVCMHVDVSVEKANRKEVGHGLIESAIYMKRKQQLLWTILIGKP